MVDYFISNKEKYILHISLGNKIEENLGVYPSSTTVQSQIPLDFQNIGLLTWSNEMNRLYLTGTLEYTDTNGIIDRIVEKQLTFCNVEFSHDPQDGDGDIKPNTIDNTITLNFIINNVEILENTPGKIKYKFHLLSENYFNLYKTAKYTNYKDKKESVTDIIMNILKNCADLTPNAASFTTNASASTINYIAQDNDDIQTAIKYLLHKTFYNPSIGTDTSLKTLIYNEQFNVIYLFDTRKGGNKLGCFPPVAIKVLKNDSDFTQDAPVYMGYMSRDSKIDGIINTQDVVFYSYDIETNSFSSNKDGLSQKKIQNLYNGEKNGNPKMFFTLKEDKFGDSSTEWNSNSQIYENTFKSLMYSNGLIINQFGWIGTTPGYTCEVSIPNNFPTYNEDKSDNDFEKMKYQYFTGSWDVFKVENYINPQKSVFRQKLCLYRNEAQY